MNNHEVAAIWCRVSTLWTQSHPSAVPWSGSWRGGKGCNAHSTSAYLALAVSNLPGHLIVKKMSQDV